MRTTRSYIDSNLPLGSSLELPDAIATHLVRVLRLGVGDELILFNGDGKDYRARIAEMGKRSARVDLLDATDVKAESPLRITLAQAIARGEKMDWVLQKATELGVSCIAAVSTERTEVRLDAERSDRRMQHWEGVVASACEQCGRARLPKLVEPQSLSQFLASQQGSSALLLALDPQGDLHLDTLPEADELCLVIGPEGGLSNRDMAAIRAAGGRGLRLGPRILRTETAGLAAISALQARLGDWR
ncbi:MAG: Ribosomal RNA small subunit methyltransferase E [Alphaproteobacteria bacterium ADurb.BinA280]|jgi:16S rRNA (uracil1498-N3)-methyltransferase|nr:MAG: Ribosomal RNA small subunit methyltransferase E [Alphaproteobacteria bacterium ADurb.BinA280]